MNASRAEVTRNLRLLIAEGGSMVAAVGVDFEFPGGGSVLSVSRGYGEQKDPAAARGAISEEGILGDVVMTDTLRAGGHPPPIS